MINIKYIWKRNYEDKRSIPLHSHDFYEFVFYGTGVGETTIDSRKHKFHNGSFALIPPFILHSEKHDHLSSVYIIGFEIDREMKTFSYSEQENVAISEVVMNIFQENRRKNILYERIIDLYIQQLLALIERDQSPDNKKGRSSSIDTAGAYIDEYCLTTINLKELASNIGYCTDRFRNLFKSHFGVTPKQYILDKKLKESKRMLVESKYTLEQISTMVGFNYYSRFSLFFKEKTGVSPKEYRDLIEKK